MTDKEPTANWKNRAPGKAGETYTVDHLIEAFNLNRDDAEQLIIKYNGDCKRNQCFGRCAKGSQITIFSTSNLLIESELEDRFVSPMVHCGVLLGGFA